MSLSVITKENGAVIKKFINVFEESRYKNELKILQYLNNKNCPICPKLYWYNDFDKTICMEDCGDPVKLTNWEMTNLSMELETYGVRHFDVRQENIVEKNGIRKLIDFESCRII